MATDMKTVKAIQYNNKSLKNIKDSNGNIIWGSQSDYPYRRLEYIHFSGSEYLTITGYRPQKSFHFLDVKIPPKTTDWQFVWGAAHTINNVYYRLFWQTNTDKKGYYRLKGDNTAAWDMDTYANTLLELRCRIYNTNNTTGEFWWAVSDASNVPMTGEPTDTQTGYTQIYGRKVSGSSYAVNFANFTSSLCIGGYMQNGTIGSLSACPIMNLYRYYVRASDDASQVVNLLFPCQRKSDGVCGLYNVKNGYFFPMTGTNITNAAAGPVIDEYWDLTA